MSLLSEILKIKREEYKKKTYNELLLLVNEDIRFSEVYAGRSFNFTIHVTKDKDRLKIMIECSKDIFFLHMFFKYSSFSVSKSGEIEDAE